MDGKKLKVVLIGLLLYVISTAISYGVFAKVIFSKQTVGEVTSPVAEQKKDKNTELVFNNNLPKTEQCPINGVLYSKDQKKWWDKHRPLGVMIENHKESRPQSGLSRADVIYEAVAEGAITRFLAVFYCQDAGVIGPVRSARTYFLDFISEYGDYPLYAHVGGANTPGPADALSQIEGYGWGNYNDLNQFSIEFPYFWRDYDRLGHAVATEHTVYSNTSKLWSYASDKRKLTNLDKKGNSWDDSFIAYKFKEASSKADSQSIKFDFWEDYKDYTVEWKYDKTSNSYLRFNAGAAHMDKDNNKQIAAKDVVVLFMTERNANDGYENNLHLLYGTKGSGKAIFFRSGEQIVATWVKKNRTSRTVLTDSAGREIEFNPGLIWFEILPIGTDVVVK